MRKKKSMLNFLADVIPYLILGVLNFFRINFLIKYYGNDINGYMQLVTQIFAYLSLAEAGFGTAVIYKLYKPLANNDKKTISAIVNGSKIIFKKIATIMLIGAVIISFLLPVFINKGELSTYFIIIVFLLYTSNYLTEYFLIYPYTSLLQADQNQYVFNFYKNIIRIAFGILELILLYFSINIILIITINIIFTIFYVILVKKKVKKVYPWLDKKIAPDTTAFKMTKDVFAHRLSTLVFSKTDPIILSAFSLAYVSIYTAFNYILDFITQIVSKMYDAIRASYCNIVAVGKSDEKKYFYMFLGFSFFLANFAGVTFQVTINPFVKNVWIDANHCLEDHIVLLFTIILIGRIICNPIYIARDSKGLYKETKYSTMLQALCNIVLSLILVQKYHIFGVLLATVISQYFILIPFNVYIVYKNVFPGEKITYLLKNFLLLITNSIFLYFIDNEVLNILNANTKMEVLIYIIIVIAVNFVECFIIYFFLNNDFKNLITELSKKFLNRQGRVSK